MKHLSYSVLLLATLLLGACTKEDDAPHNYATPGTYKSMADVYAGVAPTIRTTSIVVASGGSVTAQGGSRIIIPANAFVTAGGAAVTGSVQVEVLDWLKKGDMLFGYMAPVSNGEPLLSGGEAYVNVTQNGQQVFLKPGKRLQVNLPQFGAATGGMQLFSGRQINPAAGVGAATGVNWTIIDSAHGYMVYNGDTISIFSDSMHYVNADQFLANPSYQSFKVHIAGGTDSLSDLTAMAIYDQYKGMWTLGSFTNNAFNATHIPNIPVHLLVMGIKNGWLYAGLSAVTPANNGDYSVTLTKTDPLALKHQINGL